MPSYSFTHHGAARINVDLAGQILSAELEPRSGFWELRREHAGVGAPVDEGGGIQVLDESHTWTAPIYPSVGATTIEPAFTPLFALTAKAKRFDDQLIAALERLSHHGAGEHMGLFALCTQLRERLGEEGSVGALFHAATHLAAGTRPGLIGGGSIRTRKWIASFLKDAKRSKPVGIFADDEDLQRIFQHDRLLQSSLSSDDAEAIREVLQAEPALLETYRRHLELASKVTGPPVLPSVDYPEGAREYAFLPASDSAEGRLVKELFDDAPVPADFELGAELVTRIRDGRMATEPADADGWYAHQFHAIAALLTPDTQGLKVGPRYRALLDDVFKAMFALNRESHVKQLELPGVGAGKPPIQIRPRISVEPLPELYARMAAGYRYLRQVLTERFGRHVLRSAGVTNDGPDIDAALIEVEMLFRGAEVVSRFELGQRDMAASSIEAAQSRAMFRAWQRRSANDPDLHYDLRVAVPVWYDVERKTTRLCVTLGLETRSVVFAFVERPKVSVFGEQGEVIYTSRSAPILSPLTIECNVREPPTRDELRTICDREKTATRIRAALERL